MSNREAKSDVSLVELNRSDVVNSIIGSSMDMLMPVLSRAHDRLVAMEPEMPNWDGAECAMAVPCHDRDTAFIRRQAILFSRPDGFNLVILHHCSTEARNPYQATVYQGTAQDLDKIQKILDGNQEALPALIQAASDRQLLNKTWASDYAGTLRGGATDESWLSVFQDINRLLTPIDMGDELQTRFLGWGDRKWAEGPSYAGGMDPVSRRYGRELAWLDGFLPGEEVKTALELMPKFACGLQNAAQAPLFPLRLVA